MREQKRNIDQPEAIASPWQPIEMLTNEVGGIQTLAYEGPIMWRQRVAHIRRERMTSRIHPSLESMGQQLSLLCFLGSEDLKLGQGGRYSLQV